MRKISLFKVFVSDECFEPLKSVLSSGYIGQGIKVEEFENNLKKSFNNDFVMTVNSCTSALSLALHCIKSNFKPTDEIITTPFTCFASISAIIHSGFKIKWADINPKTCNIDPTDIEKKINENTKGILLVHWGGIPAELDQINALKEKYNLPIIEDCAHCWESRYKKELIGNSGNYCCFSLQAIKFLTIGDGGIFIAPNMDVYKRAKLLRWFGLDRESGASFRCIQDIKEAGFKYQINDIEATIGLYNLKHVDKLVSIHKENAKFYNKELDNVKGIELLDIPNYMDPSYWIYTIKVQNRENFIKHLNSYGIESSLVHKRCDNHTCVAEFKTHLPGMDELEPYYVAIPCGWWVTPEDREYITNVIKKGW